MGGEQLKSVSNTRQHIHRRCDKRTNERTTTNGRTTTTTQRTTVNKSPKQRARESFFKMIPSCSLLSIPLPTSPREMTKRLTEYKRLIQYHSSLEYELARRLMSRVSFHFSAWLWTPPTDALPSRLHCPDAAAAASTNRAFALT